VPHAPVLLQVIRHGSARIQIDEFIFYRGFSPCTGFTVFRQRVMMIFGTAAADAAQTEVLCSFISHFSSQNFVLDFSSSHDN
jgi:hypothetical protein